MSANSVKTFRKNLDISISVSARNGAKGNSWKTERVIGAENSSKTISVIFEAPFSIFIDRKRSGQGNVFIRICHSVNEGGVSVWLSLPIWLPGLMFLLWGSLSLVPCYFQRVTVKSGQYTSYWNAFFTFKVEVCAEFRPKLDKKKSTKTPCPEPNDSRTYWWIVILVLNDWHHNLPTETANKEPQWRVEISFSLTLDFASVC